MSNRVSFSAPKRSDFHCFVTIDVQWGEMDALGHVNNIIYFRYFETGRIKYLEAIGVANFGERNDVPVLAHVELNYRAQVTYPSRLDVGIRVPELRNRSFVMDCAIFFGGTDTLAADGTSATVWIDKTTGKAIPLPEQLRSRIAEFEKKT